MLPRIERTFNAYAIQAAAEEHSEFNAFNWVFDPKNIALTDGDGSFNLLQYEKEGVYAVHTFYKRRGKDALEMGEAALRHGFENYPIEALIGLTPVDLKAARWFNKKMGFKSQGLIETPLGPEELTILTRKEYYGSV